MAKRRMYSKDIVCSDTFRMLPLSSQALYFHLGMEADDRGYVDNPLTLMRAIGANQGDMEQLITKKFVLIRGEGLILIKGWKINNYIQKDRFDETKYIEDLKKLYYDENYSYTEHKTDRLCIQDDKKMYTGMDTGLYTGMDTQVRLGKDRLGKVRGSIEIVNNNKKESKVSKKSLNEKNITENSFENLNENDKAFIKMCIDSTNLDGKQLTYAYFESQDKADLYNTYLEIIEDSEDE